ncbi:MAG TPA: NAD(P)H-dependent oxidoreductase [Mycobacterium sp.]
MSAVVTLVGNPKPGSRTLTAAGTLADALAEMFDGARRTVIDRRSDEIEQMHRDGLLAPWRLSEAAAQAAADVKVADLLVIATPTYKASFTGLLKLFLDVLPAGSLAWTVVVPMTVSGGPAHRSPAAPPGGAPAQSSPVQHRLGPHLERPENTPDELRDNLRNGHSPHASSPPHPGRRTHPGPGRRPGPAADNACRDPHPTS